MHIHIKISEFSVSFDDAGLRVEGDSLIFGLGFMNFFYVNLFFVL